MTPAPGLARCVICRREVEFEKNPPKRCKTREGGCGVADGFSVLRMPGRAEGTRRYDPDGDRVRRVERLRRMLRRHAERRRGVVAEEA